MSEVIKIIIISYYLHNLERLTFSDDKLVRFQYFQNKIFSFRTPLKELPYFSNSTTMVE